MRWRKRRGVGTFHFDESRTLFLIDLDALDGGHVAIEWRSEVDKYPNIAMVACSRASGNVFPPRGNEE